MPDKPELIWEPGAVDDLARLREFIEPKNPKAAANAARYIIEATNILLNNPYLGHPLEAIPAFIRLDIPFGKRVYILRYRLEGNKIIIMRIWHSRENR